MGDIIQFPQRGRPETLRFNEKHVFGDTGGLRLSLVQEEDKEDGPLLLILIEDEQIGVAHHQVEVCVLPGEANAYRGRLCRFSQCPSRKQECLVPECGRDAFLQQHAGITFLAGRAGAR